MEKKTKVILAVIVAAVVVVSVVAATILFDEDEEPSAYYITLGAAELKASLITGQIDAFMVWEPFCSDAVLSGAGEILTWSGDLMPDHPCCVVVVSTEFLDEVDNADELTTRFVKSHMDATDWMAAALSDPDGDDYALLMTLAKEFTNKTDDVLTMAFDHMFYEYEVGAGFVSAISTFADMYIDVNLTTVEAVAERGYDTTTEFAESYVDESFLEAAASVEPSSTVLNPDDPIHVGYLTADLHQLAKVVAMDPRVLGGTSIYESYGLNVVNATGAPFSAGGPVMDGISAGTVDIGYLGCAPAILKHLNGNIGAKILAQANVEGSAIVVKAGAGIEDMEDLLFKTVAVPSESTIQFLMLKSALKDAGLDLVIRPA